MRKFLKVILLVICIFSTLVFNSCSSKQTEDLNKNSLENVSPNKVENPNHGIEDEFIPNLVLIVIDQNYTKQIFTEKDFPELYLEKVVCLTEYAYSKYSDGNYPEEFSHIYALYLNEKTKENVFHSIKILEKFDFVASAEPNYILSLID